LLLAGRKGKAERSPHRKKDQEVNCPFNLSLTKGKGWRKVFFSYIYQKKGGSWGGAEKKEEAAKRKERGLGHRYFRSRLQRRDLFERCRAYKQGKKS